MKKIILLTILIVSLSILLMPAFTFAQDTSPLGVLKSGLDKTIGPEGAGIIGNENEPAPALSTVLGTIINGAFGLLGTIVLAFTLLGGVLWMMAGGNEEKVARAKKFIISGIEGMIVIFMAYALVYVVLYALSQGANRAAGN